MITLSFGLSLAGMDVKLGAFPPDDLPVAGLTLPTVALLRRRSNGKKRMKVIKRRRMPQQSVPACRSFDIFVHVLLGNTAGDGVRGERDRRRGRNMQGMR